VAARVSRIFGVVVGVAGISIDVTVTVGLGVGVGVTPVSKELVGNIAVVETGGAG